MVFSIILLCLLVIGAARQPAAGRSTTPSSPNQSALLQNNEHPRLWVRAEDLPRLRSWATDSNPLWSEGLRPLGEFARQEMDAGNLPGGDDGGNTWEQYPNEMYAELFAFLSLVHPDEAARADYAQRARTLLIYVMEQISANRGNEDIPFGSREFAQSDRSRWWGEGFALTVDWIYPTLSAEDKALIRQVFLMWADDLTNADTTNFNHPEPQGVANDPALIADQERVRWAANNYYTAHMRNLGLMAMSFDEADDPGGELRGYLQYATGAWLYTLDHLLRTDAVGGFPPEGWEYGPASLGYAAQFLFALHTAGQADPALWGEQVDIERNPFWVQTIPAYYHSLSPARSTPEWDWIGQVYEPAWYGDGQHYWAPDWIGLFGPLGLHSYNTGDTDRLNAIRWLQLHTPPGGQEMFLERVGLTEVFRDAILYFMLFEPGAAEPTDPRPGTPTDIYGEGNGRIISRTSWGDDATMFTFFLPWISIDHQLAEGNRVEFYRNGEWLTKGRVGWDGTTVLCSIGRSDYHNTLALENDPIDDPTSWPQLCWQHGSQWMLTGDADGEILAHSFADDYVYVLGDATGLYNSADLGSQDIQHASRSVVWLKPDVIVIYDRATSATEGRFKRFWLNFPTMPAIDGNLTSMTTEGGQQLLVTTLLPADAELSAAAAEQLEDVAVSEPMQFRLKVEAPGGPADVRFLHVLQGADSGVSATPATLVQSAAGDFAGAEFGEAVVLFPLNVAAPPSTVTYTVSAEVRRHVITGLEPGAGYAVEMAAAADGGAQVTISAGGDVLADAGGVLHLTLEPELR
jgi:hypothetical protein